MGGANPQAQSHCADQSRCFSTLPATRSPETAECRRWPSTRTFNPNGKFYTATSFNGGVKNLCNRVQEYRVVGGSPVLQRTDLEYDNLLNPFHTLNMMAFDPLATGASKIYMTILLGDGGTQATQAGFVNHAQDLSQLYGKILRVDVSDGADAYPSNRDEELWHSRWESVRRRRQPEHAGRDLRLRFSRAVSRQLRPANRRLLRRERRPPSREEIEFIKAGTWGEDYGWARREGTTQTARRSRRSAGQTPSIRSSNWPTAPATSLLPAVTFIAVRWLSLKERISSPTLFPADLGQFRSQHGALAFYGANSQTFKIAWRSWSRWSPAAPIFATSRRSAKTGGATCTS